SLRHLDFKSDVATLDWLATAKRLNAERPVIDFQPVRYAVEIGLAARYEVVIIEGGARRRICRDGNDCFVCLDWAVRLSAPVGILAVLLGRPMLFSPMHPSVRGQVFGRPGEIDLNHLTSTL